MPRPEAATATLESPDTRLLQALADVAAEKGLAAVTVADVVRVAGVSKRTFYEHFSDKEACFLQLYRLASASALRTLREAVQPGLPWQAQVETALRAYFAHLASGPQLLRLLFVEIHHLGEAGSAVRREVMGELAAFMLGTVNRDRPAARALSEPMAVAAVGAITELVLQAIEQNRQADLTELAPAASEVVRRLAQ
ncbi:MAG: TetR/AcrR family transcriptional regulator [Hydrogenophaga sp.]|uniref:TetR/AcrR family transcriptional regulator n=1 Tax=Hydrogenophaga crocea TaxID=2716225 RepID=A0A6G8IG59_9BURK|nr:MULTISPECIES: TetR/AcrR family transcriptional regulator [Hydrogenophaga]MBL0945999.1 TetR/AcrR family transcriptional regulator [Hydrogenophaga sp.]QIM52167.1 TetR/AcrR family transcriptional regulator [Hydrogenophaga crocea]